VLVVNTVLRVPFAKLLEYRNESLRHVEPVDHQVQHRHELADLVVQRHARKQWLEARVDLEQSAIEDRADQRAIRSQ